MESTAKCTGKQGDIHSSVKYNVMWMSCYLDHLSAATSRGGARNFGPCVESVQSKEYLRGGTTHWALPLILIALIYLCHVCINHLCNCIFQLLMKH